MLTGGTFDLFFWDCDGQNGLRTHFAHQAKVCGRIAWCEHAFTPNVFHTFEKLVEWIPIVLLTHDVIMRRGGKTVRKTVRINVALR